MPARRSPACRDRRGRPSPRGGDAVHGRLRNHRQHPGLGLVHAGQCALGRGGAARGDRTGLRRSPTPLRGPVLAGLLPGSDRRDAEALSSRGLSGPPGDAPGAGRSQAGGAGRARRGRALAATPQPRPLDPGRALHAGALPRERAAGSLQLYPVRRGTAYLSRDDAGIVRSHPLPGHPRSEIHLGHGPRGRQGRTCSGSAGTTLDG